MCASNEGAGLGACCGAAFGSCSPAVDSVDVEGVGWRFWAGEEERLKAGACDLFWSDAGMVGGVRV